MTKRKLETAVDRFPIAGSFTISRGSRTEIVVVSVRLSDGNTDAQSECVPYARYGETVESVLAQIEELRPEMEAGLDRSRLQEIMPAGAARNALDCVLWDFEAKQSGKRAQQLAGLPDLEPRVTAYTLSLGTAESMLEAATAAAHRPLLKVKLGGEGDVERICAVRQGAPESRLIVDANEAWRPEIYEANMVACAEAGVLLVEQPLPSDEDHHLASLPRPVTVCADESLHTRKDLERLRPLYDAINIKLDKAGGLTESLLLQQEARKMGFEIMMGCMLGTSLAMAPAMLVAQDAEYVDLDGPLLLKEDRDNALQFDDGLIFPPESKLWG